MKLWNNICIKSNIRYTFLSKKYGLKNLVIESTGSIIGGIR